MVRSWLSAAAILLVAAGACDTEPRPQQVEQEVVGGDPEQAEPLFQAYGCVACHRIPNIVGFDARVGPPLREIADRRFIAGNIPNTPEALVAFIMEPQALRPGTAMPNLGVSEEDARHMAAYLLTLK